MPSGPLRALLCNDDAATRRAVEVILMRRGFQVVGEVATAADAVVAASVAQPDVVLLDLALTGDLGLGALSALHAASPGCAVVVVSSFDTMRAAALDAGAYDFVASTDLRALEHSLRRLAAAGASRPRPPAGDGPGAQLDEAATVRCTAALTGSLSTKAPAS